MTAATCEGTGDHGPAPVTGDDAGARPPDRGALDDAWVAVAAGEALGPGEIVESTLGGADVVVWRTAEGTPCVMEARCPHQWSHLAAAGAVAGEEIVCLTHFWTFGIDGSGWKENLNGRRDRKGDIEVHPCRESAGTIWARPKPAGDGS